MIDVQGRGSPRERESGRDFHDMYTCLCMCEPGKGFKGVVNIAAF